MIGDNRRKKFSVVPNIAAMNEERREFASKIRAARALLGWSQAELGQRVGVTQRSINRARAGRRRCAALDCGRDRRCIQGRRCILRDGAVRRLPHSGAAPAQAGRPRLNASRVDRSVRSRTALDDPDR